MEDGVDNLLGLAMPCTWVIACYNPMKQNLLPYSKSKKQGSSLGGLAFNCKRNRSARCWSSAAYPCIIRTWLGTVPEVMLEDVKGQIFRLVSAQNYLRPNVDGILLVQHLIFEPPSNHAKSSFIWPGRYTHKEQVVAYPVGRRIFQSGVQPWGDSTHRKSRPTMMNVNSRLALSTVRFFHEESKRFWQG